MTRDALTEILSVALKLGIIDIFTVIAYQANGTPSDEIVQELKDKVRVARSGQVLSIVDAHQEFSCNRA